MEPPSCGLQVHDEGDNVARKTALVMVVPQPSPPRSGIFTRRSPIILTRTPKLLSKPCNRRNQMRRLFLVLVGTLIFCSPVLAATATGTVKSISTKDDAITLSDGKTYGLPEGIEAEDLKVGQRVQVTYSKANGKIKVLAVHVLK